MVLDLAMTLTLLYIVGACLFVAFLCGIDRVIELITGRRRQIEPQEYVDTFAAQVLDTPSQQPHYCPACLCVAHEWPDDLDAADVGYPALCNEHRRRMSRWMVLDPHGASQAFAGITYYPAPLPVE